MTVLFRPFRLTWDFIAACIELFVQVMGRSESTQEEAVLAFSAMNGHYRLGADISIHEFEAAGWVIAAGGNPRLALRRFEEECMAELSDIMYPEYLRIRYALQRWAREGGCEPADDNLLAAA